MSEDLVERLRSIMPEESPIDLERYAEVVAETILSFPRGVDSIRMSSQPIGVTAHESLGEHQGAGNSARRRL